MNENPNMQTLERAVSARQRVQRQGLYIMCAIYVLGFAGIIIAHLVGAS